MNICTCTIHIWSQLPWVNQRSTLSSACMCDVCTCVLKSVHSFGVKGRLPFPQRYDLSSLLWLNLKWASKLCQSGLWLLEEVSVKILQCVTPSIFLQYKINFIFAPSTNQCTDLNAVSIWKDIGSQQIFCNRGNGIFFSYITPQFMQWLMFNLCHFWVP